MPGNSTRPWLHAIPLIALLACADHTSESPDDEVVGMEDAGLADASTPDSDGVSPEAAELLAALGAGTIRYGEVDVEAMLAIIGTPPEEDRPFYMVNYVKFRQKAVYTDGREIDISGREANAMYAPLEFLEEIGARIVFVADVETVLPLGDGTAWDQVAVVHYPSRAKFVEMIKNPDYQARAVHKDAGLEKSIVLVTEPIALPPFEPMAPVHAATDEDPPFEMIHLFNYRDVAQYADDVDEPERSGREAVELYQANAGSVALPLGVYPRAFFEVKATLIGDGRTWHEVRINHFPSHATFDALTADETWQAGRYHRTAGLEDTYALQTAPFINEL